MMKQFNRESFKQVISLNTSLMIGIALIKKYVPLHLHFERSNFLKDIPKT